jgi:hypothetical protein
MPSNFTFEMLSTPPCLSLHTEDFQNNAGDMGVPIRNYRRILFQDSIFRFFPYGEVYYKDSAGQISDKVFFVEGLEFHCKLGSQQEVNPVDGTQTGGYLEHDYVWSENQINNINMSNNVSGDNVFMLISKHKLMDYPKSRAFNAELTNPKLPISTLLTQTILPDWGIPVAKYGLVTQPNNSTLQTISVTSGLPYLIQSNITNSQFVQLLAEYAFSTSAQNSGFYTFINCQGEFFFITINDLINQSPVYNFKLGMTTEMSYDPKYIKHYRILHGGLPANFSNYNRKFFKYSASGVSSSVDQDIQAVAVPGQGKLLIQRRNRPTGKFSEITYFGLQDETNGEELFKGYKNYFYRDTAMCYRMIIVVQFNPKLVSGKVITLELSKQTSDNLPATEYAGNWVICESYHWINGEGFPYTQLTISKPKIQLDSNHILFNDFQ